VKKALAVCASTLAITACVTMLAVAVLPERVSTSADPKEPWHLFVYAASPRSFNVTSSLIYGNTESILIDTQYYKSRAAEVADKIAATGTHLKAMDSPHSKHECG
jgi:hypothetical protein